jgi:hypothetical protein
LNDERLIKLVFVLLFNVDDSGGARLRRELRDDGVWSFATGVLRPTARSKRWVSAAASAPVAMIAVGDTSPPVHNVAGV